MAGTEPLWCVVPAAGRGQRFGADIPKQYLPLGGRPMLIRTLERLAACAEIGGLMVVLASDDDAWPGINDIAGKPVLTAQGATERSGSVLAGLRALPASVGVGDFVMVHDAARPCVAAADIARLVALGVPAGGALLAAPVRDTLKRGDTDAHVTATEPRERLWRALTPQMFRYGVLDRALGAVSDSGAAPTDEAQAVEALGLQPRLVRGDPDNIKITLPEDVERAARVLASWCGA